MTESTVGSKGKTMGETMGENQRRWPPKKLGPCVDLVWGVLGAWFGAVLGLFWGCVGGDLDPRTGLFVMPQAQSSCSLLSESTLEARGQRS